jgi:phenylacetic acid degradation operon negative regulatory protein
VHARSAVVDLYGDHLRQRGWWAPVSAVVALASSVGVQAPATRTAVSRLTGEGWLQAVPRREVRGYAATAVARTRLEEAHRRIYAPAPGRWDGCWHLVSVDPGGDRRRRDQVAATLSYLGYGRVGPGTWVSPWASPELADALARHGAGWTGVHGPLTGAEEEADLVTRVWDTRSLARGYHGFLTSLPEPDGAAAMDPEQAYPVRTRLVHEWRKFLFLDPGLPLEVLPDDWPGQSARTAFLRLADQLRPAADHFVSQRLRSLDCSP